MLTLSESPPISSTPVNLRKSPAISKKRRDNEERFEASTTQESIATYLKEKLARKSTRPDIFDKDELFLLSLQPHFARVPKEKKARCQIQILQTILEFTDE